MLLRSEEDQEIVSRDKRDRRDYEQISNLAKRMGLYRYWNVTYLCLCRSLVDNCCSGVILIPYFSHCQRTVWEGGCCKQGSAAQLQA